MIKKQPSPFHQPRVAQILIVDDHPMVRERLEEVIRRHADLHVCGQTGDATHARQLIETAKPDLAMVDIALKQSDGLDLITDLRVQAPQLLILVVSMYEESLYGERALRAGAHGYINKQEATRNIVTAIRRILNGETYISEQLAQTLAARVVGRPAVKPTTALSALSDRELQVFTLIGEGHTVSHVGAILHVANSTVETHRDRIREKLNLPDANAVLRAAIAWRQTAAAA